MIMLLTHRSEIREELNASLHARGYETCVPAHRNEVRTAMTDRYPDLIVLDLYLLRMMPELWSSSCTLGFEVIKGNPIVVAFPQHRIPAESLLSALQGEEFE